VGRYTASNGQITAGYQDYVILPGTTKGNNTFTGSYTAPDPATGRYTESWDMSTSSTPTQSVEYIVSATQFYRLVTVANGGLLSGDVDAQTATSFTSSSLKGTIVSYGNGRAYSNGSVSGLDSWVNQGTADGNGNLTINQSYTNANGTYASGSQNDQIIAITFDSTNPGRATFTPSGGGYGYLYFTGNNNALEMVYNSTTGYMESGNLNTQSQTTFTDDAVAGNYLFGEAGVTTPGFTSQGELGLDSEGNVTGGLSTGGEGYFAFDLPQSLTYQWDASAAGVGGLLIGGSNESSCIVNSSTRIICIVNTSPEAANFILLQ
jgi:hypothetical protein